MFGRKPWIVLAAAVTLAPALAGNPTDEKVARLEALLNAQQQKINQLERQIGAAGQQNMDQQRVEAMREQIRSVLSEREFRESLMPTMLQAGYDKGFYIRSTDEKFLMKFNGQMQFRWTHYATRSTNRYLRPGQRFRSDRTGFDLQRARFKISGHAYTEDLTYQLVMRADAPDAWDVVVHYAWLNYRMTDEFQIKAGVFRLASTRSQLMDDSKFQFVDRPVTDAVFGSGIGQGIRFWGRLFDKQLDWYLDVVNALNSPGNRTITTDPAEHDNNPAILFRMVWHAMTEDAENPGSEFLTEGDPEMTESPALDFGFGYIYNRDDGDLRTTRIPFPMPRRFRTGGFGLTNTNGVDLHQFNFDTAFKYGGFSLVGEYIVRIVAPHRESGRLQANWVRASGSRADTVQHGAYVQAGYMLPIPGLENQIEWVARVGGVSTLARGQEGTWEYATGFNYYIKGHDVKLQFDMTKVSEVPISDSYSSLANVNDDALIFRVQLQLAF
jgi:hypothetical protein